MIHDQPKVLVVDDESENIDYVKRALRGKYQTFTAMSGAEGLELIKEHEFALIVSDHRMPEMSGVEFLHKAMEMSPETVRIILTGFADLDATIDAINLSRVTGFLRKPISPAELVGTIENAMELHDLRGKNEQLIRDLESKNQELQEKERMLELSLDEKSRELLAANKRLEEMVIRDGLTGLYNHRYFQERADQEVARARRYETELSLVFCDLDHFKSFNDTLGHPQGDEALKEFAQILSGRSRKSDIVARVRDTDVVARYGGEEFVILLPQTPKAGAMVMAERIRKVVEQHPFDGQDKLPGGNLTASLGVACLPTDAHSREELIECADQALYLAKNGGRNRVAAFGKD